MKEKNQDFLREHRWVRPEIFFAFGVGLSLIVWFFFVMFKGEPSFTAIFFNRCNDTFMDFFNSIRDASQGEGAYTERHVIYPPMANLLYLVLSRFLPQKYLDTSFKKRLTWVDDTAAVMVVFLFHLLLLLAVFWLVYRRTRGADPLKFAVSLTCVFSLPMLYALERGNMLLLCTVLLCVYAETYRSESKWKREVGLISLALAFSLKLYPVVFGWYLLTDKRYKDAIRCAIYGVAFLVLPSFFFGGPAVFVTILENILTFSSGGTKIGTISVIAMTAHLPEQWLTAAVYLNVLLLAMLAVAAPFLFPNDRAKQWTVGLCAVLSVPSLTSAYAWSLFLPVLPEYFDREMHGSDWFYFALTAAPFLIVPGRFNYYLSLNQLIIYFALAVLDLTLLCEGVIAICGKIRRRKEKKETEKKTPVV